MDAVDALLEWLESGGVRDIGINAINREPEECCRDRMSVR
jgi:hypothetical protein